MNCTLELIVFTEGIHTVVKSSQLSKPTLYFCTGTLRSRAATASCTSSWPPQAPPWAAATCKVIRA